MNLKISIIGLGYVGLPLAVEFGKKYLTVGYDINHNRVKELKKGIDNTTGGIILWDIKKKVISLFLTIPALKV